MDLETYVGAIVAGRGAEVDAPPPLLNRVGHLLAACAAWGRVREGMAATPRQLARGHDLVVEGVALSAGVPFVLVGRTVLCSLTKGGQARGLRTCAAVAFVVLRAGGSFSASDVWLVAHLLATRGSIWAGPPSLMTPAA